MIITLDHMQDTRVVQYELADGPRGDVASVPYMKIERPGSYAPGYEDMRYETLKVRSCRIHLVKRQAMWHVDAIAVVLIAKETTMVKHFDGSDDVPLWLASLAAQATQEDA